MRQIVNIGLALLATAAMSAAVSAVSKGDENSEQSTARLFDPAIRLPEDGGVWHLSVFTREPPQTLGRRVLLWFETDERLLALRGQTKWHHYTTADSHYQRHWSDRLRERELPAVILQRADGQIVYKQTNAHMPLSGHDQARAIRRRVEAYAKQCDRYGRDPYERVDVPNGEGDLANVPDVPAAPEPVPYDEHPRPQPADRSQEGNPWMWLLVAGAAVAAKYV